MSPPMGRKVANKSEDGFMISFLQSFFVLDKVSLYNLNVIIYELDIKRGKF